MDSWIDDLDVHIDQTLGAGVMPSDRAVSLMLTQQGLPRMEIAVFDGSPENYIDFITQFYDLIHKEDYLSGIRKCTLLFQHLTGEAKKSVAGQKCNWRGYCIALKRIKHLFGDPSRVAMSVIKKITRGSNIRADDGKGLVEFYYHISDCVVNLEQLNNFADLCSSEVLCRTVSRLPRNMQLKWSEQTSRLVARNEQPSLRHLESWLRDKVTIIRDARKYEEWAVENKGKPRSDFNGMVKNEGTCFLCEGAHYLNMCDQFKKMQPKERLNTVRKMRLCFLCFRKGHRVGLCKAKFKCPSDGCGKKHNLMLHGSFTESNEGAQKSVDEASKVGEKSPHESEGKFAGVLNSDPEMYLQIVPVILKSSGGRKVSTYALLDSGSHVSLIRNDLVSRLKLKGEKRLVNIGTVKEKASGVSVKEVELSVCSEDGTCEFKVNKALALPKSKFQMPAQPLPANYDDASVYTHLDGLALKAVAKEEIGILIGANVPDALIVSEVRKGREGQPLAVKTKLGWSLFGASDEKSQLNITVALLHKERDSVSPVMTRLWGRDDSPKVMKNEDKCTADDALHEQVEKFWKLETSAISRDNDVAMSGEDRVAMTTLENETRLVDGRYEVPMLWREKASKLPNNEDLVRKRFKFLLKRFRKDPALYASFKGVIDAYIRLGYARKMTAKEAAILKNRTWALPMHPVYSVHKPGKTRVVNDAACKYGGTSLNESLVTGPDLLNSLVGVLIRFRVGQIAITADVEAMFHQVRVNDQDADSLRFLWTDNIWSDSEEYHMQMCVHIFGAKDSLTCAIFALHRTAEDNKEMFSGSTIDAVYKSFYVDDLLHGVEREEDAIQLIKELTELLKRGGFRLTKWVTNSARVLETIPKDELSKNMTVNLDKGSIERALGIKWDVVSDCFTFELGAKNVKPTKRAILKTTSSVFDPLGFITPFVLTAKLILQEMWRRKIEWDEEINGDLAKHWENWLENAEELSKVAISRCYSKHVGGGEIQLHIFCDASELAFGCVAYLRYCTVDGSCENVLVMAKSKLAPIKVMSLPRLELSAAVIGVRMFKTIMKELRLPIKQTYFWSDSMLTLQYIASTTQRFKTFVANRVAEILEASTVDQWRHVPGEFNPADLASRGVKSPTELLKENKHGTLWFTGPAFLKKGEGEWPSTPSMMLDVKDPEVKTKEVLMTFVEPKKQLIDIMRFSNWTRLYRTMTWVLRFVFNCRNSVNKMHHLTLEEMEAAINSVIREVQWEVFPTEMEALGRNESPKKGVLTPLTPFIDDMGLMRVGGRLTHASLPKDSKNPVILPKNHHLTELIIRDEHKKNGHVGKEHTLSELRKHYWVIHGRAVVKRMIQRCFFCRIRKAKAIYPYMADLPKGRTAFGEPPFSHCGVDLFGPIQIKQGRKRLKRWGVLFTCLTIRCVHLEVVENADTDAFINALRRFVNRRAAPSVIYSDCGTNFKGASSELKDFTRSLDQEKIEGFCGKVKIKWKFNPPSAPHMGGAWERMVRSTKEIMYGLMVDKILTDDQLYTLMTEVESILNSRPITHLSDDPEDLEALTPNHILLGLHRNWAFVHSSDEREVASRRKWKQVQALSIMFWERWKTEYLPSLIKRTKWTEPTQSVKEGELVLVMEDGGKKGSYPLGRVTELIPSSDGNVRVVKVRTKTGTYTRPVAKIARLEDNNHSC